MTRPCLMACTHDITESQFFFCRPLDWCRVSCMVDVQSAFGCISKCFVCSHGDILDSACGAMCHVHTHHWETHWQSHHQHFASLIYVRECVSLHIWANQGKVFRFMNCVWPSGRNGWTVCRNNLTLTSSLLACRRRQRSDVYINVAWSPNLLTQLMPAKRRLLGQLLFCRYIACKTL